MRARISLDPLLAEVVLQVDQVNRPTARYVLNYETLLLFLEHQQISYLSSEENV